MKSQLQDNNIEIYSTHKEGKYVVAGRIAITLKNKIYKYMTPILKNVYINKLDDIVNKFNNTYHRNIETKPTDVKPSIYINFIEENIEEGPKFKIESCQNIQI